MDTDRFVVETGLDASSFEHQREARVLLRRVTVELRRLEQADPRISRPRIRRSRIHRGAVDVTLTIAARSPQDAADLGIATLRASIHAAGGCTAGWNGLTSSSPLIELVEAA